MSGQVGVLCEAPMTFLAFVGLLASVKSLMNF